ncbi:TRF2-interacting telomeric protein/Rap1 C terminal domain-containing protein [Xylaria cubensis]|nr:TRF2-interacting telomeric protein/Rap1 C terminal domain-containing protein [Xylaria cubensis]
MSAPGITYSGVLATKHTTESTDVDAGVFQGLKFWISARVPLRKFYIDTLQENGGAIVPKEGNADMLICNPAKDPVPGSYSYELIADAVREGSLDLKENYVCRSSASRRPKATKNQFTKKDDDALMKFVNEMERLGESINGNNIYKNFADEHPNHTWQSWRDRWVKKLKHIRRPPISDEERSPQQKGASAAPRQGGSAAKSSPTGTRARFTAEEDDILLETIHHAIKNLEAWEGYEPYKQLASEFPQRTYTSWRERALNHVARKHKDQIAQWEAEANLHVSDNEDAIAGNEENQQTRDSGDEAGALSPVTNRESLNATRAAADAAPKNATQRDIDEDDNINVALPPLPRTRSSERSPDPKSPTKGNASIYSSPSLKLGITQPPDIGVAITTKEQFFRDYNTFLESSGITDRRIIPSVAGKAISLWDLWQSVRSKKVEVIELDWQQIAEDLGFDWVSIESVPGELQQCYEMHLAPFADAMMSFNDFSDEEDPDEDNTDAETEIPLPSSPPVRQSLKRPLSAFSPIHKHLFPQPSPKRRRLDRRDEIPSTPEHITKTWNLRSSSGPDKTPTTSPLDDYRIAKSVPQTRTRLSARNEEDDEMRDGLTDLPVQAPGRKRRLEPETQDFNFDTDEALGHSDNDSQRANTPSQQLLLEYAESPEAQSVTRTLPASQQKVVQTTPTPRRRTQIFIQSDDSDDDAIPQSSKTTRSARVPLATPRAKQKRRTLPASWVSKSSGPADSAALRNSHPSSATVPETEPHRRPTPLKETPDDIIDHFVSLGYSKNIVLRSLKATSWIIGNAGQVMEMMKQGEPLPPRTTGVWTQRDDESLALVYSKEPPSDAKGEKKRAKEMERLQAKHGPEQIALRKRYLLDDVPE